MGKKQRKHAHKKELCGARNNQNEMTISISEETLRKAIAEGILEAERQRKASQLEEEKLEHERIRKRNREILAKKNDKPDEEIKGLKLVWRLLWVKEDWFQDAELMPYFINTMAGIFFAGIEWGLYAVSVGSIVLLMKEVSGSTEGVVSILFLILTRISLALGCFLPGRIVFRALKNECKYNEDKSYMLNVLVSMIALATLLVTIVQMWNRGLWG